MEFPAWSPIVGPLWPKASAGVSFLISESLARSICDALAPPSADLPSLDLSDDEQEGLELEDSDHVAVPRGQHKLAFVGRAAIRAFLAVEEVALGKGKLDEQWVFSVVRSARILTAHTPCF